MKKSLISLLALLFVSMGSQAQLVVVPDSNIVPLVNNFVLSGVTVSNIQYTGGGMSVGSFSNGQVTNLGMTDGIVMSTGTLFLSPFIGSPASNFASTSMGEPGDPLLNTLVPGYITYDATIIEFDLIPVGNMLDFQYVFASEEYPEYVFSSFNDVFGFFISGPSPYGGNYTNENIAIIPGTSLPVAINNVNASLNSAYFVDNQAIPGMTIVYDGFTTPLMAGIHVIPGSSYHLKMAIADVGDAVFDSGIFLKAQSMKSYMITGCEENNADGARVYPNPLNASSVAEFSDSDGSPLIVTIRDCSGKVVAQQEYSRESGMCRVALGDLSNSLKQGIYFMNLRTSSWNETLRIVR